MSDPYSADHLRGDPAPLGSQFIPRLRRNAPDLRRLGAPEPPARPTLRSAQQACYEALGLALEEGHVFAAITGPAGSGKSLVLDAVLADRQDRTLRCIRLDEPDKVPARLTQQIEAVAAAEAAKPENLERHIVLAVDNAHLAADEMLRCLLRLSAMREPGRRVPQVLLAGRPELWTRLAGEEFQLLARRIAIRAVLPSLEEEVDPWAELEQDVSETMSRARRFGVRPMEFDRPISPLYDHLHADLPSTVDPAGVPLDLESVPPPTDFALFPDHSAPAEATERRDARSRFWLPVACLVVTVAAITGVLTFYDWPDLIGDMPWVSEPAKPFVFNTPATQPSHGLPRPPAWAEQGPSAREKPITTAAVAPAPQPAPAPATKPDPAPVVPAAKPAPVIAAAVTPPAPPAPAPAAASVPTPPAPAPVATAAPPAPAPSAAPPPAVAAAAPASPAPPKPAAPEPATLAAVAPALPLPPLPVHRAAAPAALPPNVIELLLHRGDELFRFGDISGARLLFERAAESGNQTGMVRLARTYDGAFLSSRDAATLADRSRARLWYGRAAAAGDHAAAARLATLERER